jgi:predicted dehydrogenase
MKKLRLGLIGVGGIGKAHLRSCFKLKIAELTAVADVSKRARVWAKTMGVKHAYTNYEELLNDKRVDAVIIALPTHLHAACAQKAAEAKKHIFIEKPMARNVIEAKKIISSAEKNGVKLMIGYPYRFNQQFVDLKKTIVSRELGDVLTVYAVYVAGGPFAHRSVQGTPQPVPRWWFQKEFTGGGALMDIGSHLINLLRWYFGEVEEIKSYLGHRFNLDMEDYAICMAKFSNGPLAIFNVGWYSKEYQFKVDLNSTVKHASVNNTSPSIIKAGVQMLLTKTSDFWTQYIRELGHFVQSVQSDHEPSPSGYDGLMDLETITRAYENDGLMSQTQIT